MFHFALKGELERDVRVYARRHCKPGDCLVHRDTTDKVVVGFHNDDRAMLFLNLFDDEIERGFEAPAKSARG